MAVELGTVQEQRVAPGAVGALEDITLASVRALHACVLNDAHHGRIGTAYRNELLKIRAAIDVILSPDREMCGRCDHPLGAEDRVFHARCP